MALVEALKKECSGDVGQPVIFHLRVDPDGKVSSYQFLQHDNSINPADLPESIDCAKAML